MEKYIDFENLDSTMLLVDIREKPNFEFGHLEGAINLSEDEVLKLETNKQIVLCCRNGKKSEKLCEKMKQQKKHLYGCCIQLKKKY